MNKLKDSSDAKAVLVMFHGLNSHIGHGAHIAEALAEVGIITVGFDHRGFGKSEGKSGYVESLESHLYDAKVFVEKIKAVYPNLPMFATGLSMGGMTTYFLALRDKAMFKGVVLMAPSLKNIHGGTLVGMVIGIASLLPKSFRLITPPRGMAARNPKITEDIINDKYAFSDRASLKTVETLVHTMDIAPMTFDKFDVPFVIVQGDLDKLVNPIGAFDLYDKSSSKDKQVHS
jgi:acylglycerol lipase